MRRYPNAAAARRAAQDLVDRTGRHHVVWRVRYGYRIVRLHSLADHFLRATIGARQTRVLATAEQRALHPRTSLLRFLPGASRIARRQATRPGPLPHPHPAAPAEG